MGEGAAEVKRLWSGSGPIDAAASLLADRLAFADGNAAVTDAFAREVFQVAHSGSGTEPPAIPMYKHFTSRQNELFYVFFDQRFL